MTTIKLKDCANIKTGKLNSNAAVIGGIYPFFTCDPETSQIDYFSFDEEAILLAGNNASGKFNIKYYVGKFNAYQRTYIINSSTDILATKYLYYFLSTKLPQFTTLSSGSATKFLTKALLDNCDIEVPSLAEQSHIVDILGTLDEKIENLEEINSKLQSYCIAQYQLLFSDVERVPLSNIATITMGQSPAGNTLNEQDGVIFYQGRTDFGFRYPTVRLFTTDPKRMAKAGDILLSVRAPVGDVNIASEDCCIGRGIASISSKYTSFVYYSFLNQKNDFDIYNNSGTIFGSINREGLSSFNLPASNIALIEKFESIASEMDKAILNNTIEINKLHTLKQAYLQKFFG